MIEAGQRSRDVFAKQTRSANPKPGAGQRVGRRTTSVIVYFDTSAIIPVIIEEQSTQIACRLWDEADRVVSSRLIYVEGRAALAMAARMDRFDEHQLRSAVEEFETLYQQLDIVEVTEDVVRDAGALAEQFSL